MLLDETPICPASVNCSTTEKSLEEHLVSLEIGQWPSYIALVSSTFSCLGSILIIVIYFTIKDIRTGAQKIITQLALADFISAAGYILGSINFLAHFNKHDPNSCKAFEKLCLAQATITTWSSMVSFWWTVILAFYFCLIIVYRRLQLASKLMPLYNIIAWGSPLLIVIPLFATGNLGYAPYAASNWCFVKVRNYSDPDFRGNSGVTVLIVFMAGKLWEILSYGIVFVLYLIITVHIARTRRKMGNGWLEYKMLEVETRLLAIPILFVLLRIWGTVQFFFSLSVGGEIHDGCVPKTIHIAFFVLGLFQAVGDGGQGWGNAILYVFLSPTIRRKMFDSCCGMCIEVLEEGQNVNRQQSQTDGASKNRSGRNINVNREFSSEHEPLVSTSPAVGYNIKRYDTTDTCHTDGAEMNCRVATEKELVASNMSTAT